jgi:hypothetical protein
MNMEGHTDIVVCLTVVDKALISGSMDGKIKVSLSIFFPCLFPKVWDLNSFTPLREASLGPVFSLRVGAGYLFSGHSDQVKVLTDPSKQSYSKYFAGLGSQLFLLQINISWTQRPCKSLAGDSKFLDYRCCRLLY